MTSNSKPSVSTKFYQEDVIRRIGSPNAGYGVVMRCWHDAEDYTVPEEQQADPLMRALKQGEVGVSFFPSGLRDILPESLFTLVDRIFQPGDLCKRSIDDVCSGIVTSVHTEVRLAHSVTDEPVEGWKALNDIERSHSPEVQDYVLHDDWIGQVIEVFDESLVQVTNGQIVCLPEFGSRLSVGDRGDDIVPTAMGQSSMFNFILGNNRRPASTDTVIDVKHTVLAISWLAINQTLDPVDAQDRKRPDRFWYGERLSELTLVKTRSDQDLRAGDRVVLKDTLLENLVAPISTHGEEGDAITVKKQTVKETRTSVNVLWQNGTQEVLRSTELIPYLNPDEYDCWPGDHVIWKNEDQQRAAVVQCVNARERLATIHYLDTNTTELASVLELDPHGTSEWVSSGPQSHLSSLGVRRGDFVFIHREGRTNGVSRPRVPKIGELEEWVREVPMTPEGQMSGWRLEMTEIGAELASNRRAASVSASSVKRPLHDDPSSSWCGEVTGLRLDGTVEVTHPNSTTSVYPLERLTKLYDGFDQLEDDGWDDIEGGEDEDSGEGVWLKDDQGIWQYHLHDADDDDWEEMEGNEDEETPSQADEDEDFSMDVDEVQSLESSMATSMTTFPSAAFHNQDEDTEPATSPNPEGGTSENTAGDTPWAHFDILPSAPQDHAFYSSAPAQPSKVFLGRLSKEYRVLSSSLPDSILVRAYEDRTDLLRSVIIGPENTPYEDAPFVIDWMLDSNFPHSPPIAHFLSWTNGNGRVNPNLYEEGKVCLSILGTWSGDKSETWSASRSSLLQALVSIQGLVLVKEPWFCEPAYEKLRGTEEGIVNSRLYNEKAYCLSRGFVRRALELPLGGVESDISWLYYTNGRLAKVIRDSRALMEKSRGSSHGDEGDLAVPRLTAGGIITLERTLMKLQALLEKRP